MPHDDTIPFSKMHGAGNDYIVFDATHEPAITDRLSDHDIAALTPRICARRTGIGADGVILVDGEMPRPNVRVINADGGNGDLCGNGLRCVIALIARRSNTTHVTLHAAERDIIGARESDGSVTIEMGPAHFDPDRIPINTNLLRRVAGARGAAAFSVAGFELAFVNVGNPHAVIFTARPVDEFNLDRHGPELEHHPAFPQRMNIHVAQIADDITVHARNHERGVGETLACGTGACAIVAAAALARRLKPEARVVMPGGVLNVQWNRATNQLTLNGPVTHVCDGYIPLDHG